MSSYQFMVSALKSVFKIGAGHLDDLVRSLREVGVGITLEDVKVAKPLMIKASTALREDRGVEPWKAVKMLTYARKVMDAVSRKVGGEHA